MPCTSVAPAGWPVALATDVSGGGYPARGAERPGRRARCRVAAPPCSRAVPGAGTRSVNQCLVDELAQLRADPVGAGREQLGEERYSQFLLRVDPERGTGGPAPGKLNRRADQPARHRVGDHGEPQPEADPAERELGVQGPAEGVQVQAAGKM